MGVAADSADDRDGIEKAPCEAGSGSAFQASRIVEGACARIEDSLTIATKKKGILTRSHPQWWRHLRHCKRAFWEGDGDD